MLDRVKSLIVEIKRNIGETTWDNGIEQYVSNEDMEYLIAKIEDSRKDKSKLKDFCYKL